MRAIHLIAAICFLVAGGIVEVVWPQPVPRMIGVALVLVSVGLVRRAQTRYPLKIDPNSKEAYLRRGLLFWGFVGITAVAAAVVGYSLYTGLWRSASGETYTSWAACFLVVGLYAVFLQVRARLKAK